MADDASTPEQPEDTSDSDHGRPLGDDDGHGRPLGDDDGHGRPLGDDDELRRRFREALAHKHSGGPHGSGDHPGGKNPAPSSNDKRQRTFRRKSG